MSTASPSRWRQIASPLRLVLTGAGSRGATLQTFLARGAVLAVNLATGIFVTRLLGPEGRGEQAALAVSVWFFAGILSLGLPSALIYRMSRQPEDRARLFGAALVLGVGLGLLGTVLGAAFIPLWIDNYSDRTVMLAQILMVTCVFSLLIPFCTSALEATGDFTTPNLVRFLNPMLTLGALLVVAAAGHFTPLTATLCYIGSGVVLVMWLVVKVWRRVRPTLRRFARSVRELLHYGLRAYGIDILNTLALQLDQVLVVGLLYPAQAGSYFAALSAARVLNVVQMSVVTVVFPKASARSPEAALALVATAARWTFAGTLALAIPVFALGPVLIELLYGEAFLRAVPLLRLLVVEVFISSLVVVLAQSFMALGKPGWIAILQAIGLCLAAPLMALLIPVYGLEGVGIALVASSAVRFVFILLAYRLVLEARPPSLILRPSDVRALLRRI